MSTASTTAAEPPPARTLVVVCTYNERKNLPSLVDAINGHMPAAEVLVVDDDSPDGTGEWASGAAGANPRLHCLVRHQDRGLGAALREAMQWAVARDYDWMLNLDADFSHDPADLPRLLDRALRENRPIDCVVGTRYASGGAIRGWSLHRRLMSRAVNRFATRILRLPVSDCSGSLRCYRVAALRRIAPDTLRSRGYAIFEEVLVRLRRAGATMAEVPIVFSERRSGASKLTLVEALKSAAQIVRLSLPGSGR